MPASTSTQRTYRYVRLGILAAVLALAVSVAAVIAGSGALASISAVHYSAGSPVFTGSLFAIALAFLALAGRSPSQVLLDLAALVAPLIALVPTTVESGDVPGLAVDCDLPCVPATELPGIANGLLAYVVVAAAVVVAGLLLARAQGTLGPGVVVTSAVAAALLVAGAVWWIAAPDAFVRTMHAVAATAFFAIIAAVSALAARRTTGPFRALYATVAIAIVIDLAALVATLVLRFAGIDLARASGVPFVFVGEAVAVALFAVFWIAQTVENWDDVDPALRAAAPVPPSLPPRARRAG